MRYLGCLHCIHLGKGLQCKAFDEIPIEIWSGLQEHTEPVEGQKNNFVYQAVPRKREFWKRKIADIS